MPETNDPPHSGRIGVLAFGSLIDNAGELDEATVARIPCETPFPIEFARSSRSRDGAPTLVPVPTGGARARCLVLVLRSGIDVRDVMDRLYRRELNRIGGNVVYRVKPQPSTEDLVIRELHDFAGCDKVLYACFSANIDPLDAQQLAHLAIASAKAPAGAEKRDGITYLANARLHGVVTPLSPSYEAAVLRLTGGKTLDEAWQFSRDTRSNPEESERWPK